MCGIGSLFIFNDFRCYSCDCGKSINFNGCTYHCVLPNQIFPFFKCLKCWKDWAKEACVIDMYNASWMGVCVCVYSPWIGQWIKNVFHVLSNLTVKKIIVKPR